MLFEGDSSPGHGGDNDYLELDLDDFPAVQRWFTTIGNGTARHGANERINRLMLP